MEPLRVYKKIRGVTKKCKPDHKLSSVYARSSLYTIARFEVVLKSKRRVHPER
jgi:hypothetical protein